MRPVRYVSLFSGVEAATLAWGPLGWEAMAFCEVEPFPCAVLAHRYPDIPNLGDVREDDWTRVPYRGRPAEECPDGPRYKAIGNSMAVPVMRWIGERAAAVLLLGGEAE